MTQPQERRGARRRGDVLEATILAAVWEELAEVGYSRLTMEGVAARARTGKQVLYRRWRNRAELVFAAIGHTHSASSVRVPDTGELRADVLDMLRQMVRRQLRIGSDVLQGLIAEVPDLDQRQLAPRQEVMATVLTRAAERGEIASADLPDRVVTVAIDLLRHQMLVSREPITEDVLTEIVDDVFLPLVHAAAPLAR